MFSKKFSLERIQPAETAGNIPHFLLLIKELIPSRLKEAEKRYLEAYSYSKRPK